jgi:predicted nucleotidyltransferase
MDLRFEAAWEVHQFLNKHRIPYVIIGGIAIQKWGDPRFTKDVDMTIATSLTESTASLVRLITTRFPSRITDAQAFVRRSRMILVTASNGIEIDISLAMPGYEDEVLARAVDYELEKGKHIRLCSAEDLIIHKSVAGRPQDVTDIQGVIYRQRDKLDVAYIRQWLKQFAEALETDEPVERFETAWQTYRKTQTRRSTRPRK